MLSRCILSLVFSLLSIIGIILYYHKIPCYHLIILSRYFFFGLSSLTRFIVVLSCCLCILSRCLLLELYYTITRFLFLLYLLLLCLYKYIKMYETLWIVFILSRNSLFYTSSYVFGGNYQIHIILSRDVYSLFIFQCTKLEYFSI